MRGWFMMGLALIAMSAPALGCSSSDSADDVKAPPILDGVYRGDADGDYAWAGLHGSDYVLWTNTPACQAQTAAAALCQETGTFTFDGDQDLLALTNGANGQTRTLHIEIGDTRAQGSLLGQAFLGGGQMLVNGGGSQLVASQFAVYKPADQALVAQPASLRTTTFALLQCLAILSGDPADKKIEVPAPPPVVQTIGGCDKKK